MKSNELYQTEYLMKKASNISTSAADSIILQKRVQVQNNQDLAEIFQSYNWTA